MSQGEIDKLILKVLNQNANQEEEDLLEEWKNKNQRNRHVFEAMKQVWQERSLDPRMVHLEEQSQRIWEKAMTKERFPQMYKNASFYLNAKIAAAIVFLFVIGAAVYWASYQKATEIVPIKMVQQTNPAGQKSKLFLPDGSVIWLNSESTLTYPEKFSDTLRLVTLEGEAYFEVSKDTERPFRVNTGSVGTTALGTSFNINAPKEGKVTISLLTGKVKIEEDKAGDFIILEPGTGFQFNYNNGQHTVFPIKHDNVLAWKMGILVFDGDSFEQVAKKIHAWYGVEVQIKGTPPRDWKLTGKFENENLSNVIETIKFSRKFEHKLDSNKLLITFN